MPHVDVQDRSSTLEAIMRHALRRRRRDLAEAQPARCPLCQRVMILLMERRGPCFRCACDARDR
jgi:hypothetical protein